MPRAKKYDWSDKRDLCYRLFVEEKRTLQELRDYFAQALGVAADSIPSDQTFNRQFKEWGFPRRWEKTSPEAEAKIVERIRQLWELSYSNGAIAQIMRNEGYDLTELRIGRLRRKHGLLLRNEHDFADTPRQSRTSEITPLVNTAPEPHQAQDVFNAVHDFSGLHHQHAGMLASGSLSYQPTTGNHGAAQMMAPAAARKRTLDPADHTGEALQTKKRRRRLRDHGALAADGPDVPPRYKSETSLNECKAYLQLDNDRYQTLRQQFMDICNEANITKKTKCEPGQWEGSKDRLIRENLHLNAVMHIPHPNPNEVANALEVICSDVTKKIRVENTRVTIQDANNGLRINPAESKRIRHIFYEMLDQEGFTTKTNFEQERYDELFRLWFTKNDTLVRIQQEGIDTQKLKYLKVLTRDAEKRLCDARIRDDPDKRMWVEGSYGPGPAAAKPKPKNARQPKEPKAPRRKRGQDIKPAALDPSLAIFAPAPPVPSPIPLPVEAEFHLAPESRLVGFHPKVWTAQLEKCSVPGAHKAGTGKTGAARVGKLFGLIKRSGVGTGQSELEAAASIVAEGQDRYPIETDNDLVAYLHTAKELAGEKVVFEIELSGGYA